MKLVSSSTQFGNVELKYCERCGNIWLRRSGSERKQCDPCAQAEASLRLERPGAFLQIWNRFRAEVQA